MATGSEVDVVAVLVDRWYNVVPGTYYELPDSEGGQVTFQLPDLDGKKVTGETATFVTNIDRITAIIRIEKD